MAAPARTPVLPPAPAAPLLHRRYARWGTVLSEVAAGLPGDELVPAPRTGSTRAVTVDAPPGEVRRWLVQIGQGRGGLYSFDGLKDLLGCDIHSADAEFPDLQDLQVGDEVRLHPAEGTPAYRGRARCGASSSRSTS